MAQRLTRRRIDREVGSSSPGGLRVQRSSQSNFGPLITNWGLVKMQNNNTSLATKLCGFSRSGGEVYFFQSSIWSRFFGKQARTYLSGWKFSLCSSAAPLTFLDLPDLLPCFKTLQIVIWNISSPGAPNFWANRGWFFLHSACIKDQLQFAHVFDFQRRTRARCLLSKNQSDHRWAIREKSPKTRPDFINLPHARDQLINNMLCAWIAPTAYTTPKRQLIPAPFASRVAWSRRFFQIFTRAEQVGCAQTTVEERAE